MKFTKCDLDLLRIGHVWYSYNIFRHDINLRSDFLDTPDVYWEREELEILYKSMCTYLNLPKRTKVIGLFEKN